MKNKYVPNEILTSKAKPVTAFDKKLKNIIADMIHVLQTTKNPKGVGLAAPQIGISLRIFLTRPTEKSPIRVFINPEIINQSPIPKTQEKDSTLEGCLSVPKIWAGVRRSLTLTLTYQDEEGVSHKEEFTGFHATIIQHETDHINGILFPARVLEQKGKFYQTVRDSDGKEVLEEITIG